MYSLFPVKYVERQGAKDIGTNFWNHGRTQEIKERFVHLDNHEIC
nr:MAG TPA: anaerobic ribonucleoside triphosphate reductase [Caudoviricetes sp.]